MNSAAKEIFADLFDETAQNADLKAREEIAETMLIDNDPVDKIARQTKLSMDAIVNIAKRLSPAVAAT